MCSVVAIPAPADALHPSCRSSPGAVSRPWGLVAMAVAVCAWAGFALSTRAIAHSTLTVWDVNVIRYLVPAVLLAPWWPRAWREIRAADWRATAAIAVGGGMPFFLLTTAGAQLSSATHISIVNLGAVPVLLAAAAFLRRRRRPRRGAAAGLLAICAGIGLLAAATPGGGGGVLLLLGSATLWTVYTLAQERARLSVTTAALLVAIPSALPALAAAVPTLTRLTDAPAGELWAFLAAQGVGSGIVSIAAYTIAIRSLGAQLAGLIGAGTPALVVTLSAILFAEPLTPLALIGLALVSGGIAAQARRHDGRGAHELKGGRTVPSGRLVR